VLACNHASYLDGLALSAALPPPLVFIAKKELARQRIAGPFLRRLGAIFVERTDPEAALADAQTALELARSGKRLVFFAEGTLTRRPGLLPFRLGAFITAAQAGLPVIPVTIRGTRDILRGDQWFPRRGSVTISLAAPVAPSGASFEDAMRLRDAVREAILAACGEPDLAGEPAPFLERSGASTSS
jgi:1-acyl-sn-glycerol-3-phosphate acyltransferase